MDKRRRNRIFVAGTVVIIFVSFTLFSAVTQPTVQKQYMPAKQSIINNTFNISGPLKNDNKLNIKVGSNSATLWFQERGLLLSGDNSTHLFGTSLQGMEMSLLVISISISNESVQIPGSALSFYITNYSLSTSDQYMVLPLQVSKYYPLGYTAVNNVIISKSSGLQLISNGAYFNHTGLQGTYRFWANFTIHPTVNFGPYYTTGEPIRMSLTWVDQFMA